MLRILRLTTAIALLAIAGSAQAITRFGPKPSTSPRMFQWVGMLSGSSVMVLYRRRCQSDPSGSALVFAFLPNKLLETKSKAPRTIAISARLKAGQCQSRQ